MNTDQCLFAFLHTDHRSRNGAVYCNRAAGLAPDQKIPMLQVEIDASGIGCIEFAEGSGFTDGQSGGPQGAE